GLNKLELNGTGVTNLSPLSGLTLLTGLGLTDTRVMDLTPLTGLTRLTTLGLSNTRVTDLTPLSDLTGLTRLGLSGTDVMDLAPLSGLTGLKELWLTNSSVVVLLPLLRLLNLAEAPTGLGLTFDGCAACEVDPEIARIAEIKDNKERAVTLFAYLADWQPPVEVEALPDQNRVGFAFDVNAEGRLTLSLPSSDHDRQTALLHAILRQDVAEVMEICPTGEQAVGYTRVHRMLSRYEGALGANADQVLPPVLWNAGNKLRLELVSDADRSGTALDDQPKLPGDLRDGMEALVQVHNAFISGHPDLAALDAVRDDPVDRQKAELDRARMAAFLTALEEQTRLIVEEVFTEFRALHEQTAGETAAALRALSVERDSLDNLINRAVREALIQERGGLADDLAGDSRAAAVGVVLQDAAKVSAPFVAATFPQLVTALQPHMAAALASTHGADYPVKQALDYVVWRVKQRVKDIAE
ncbi:MAG: hypothetical protein QNJ09_18775, partial [Paracoccaceae bacterium]|nr:hypothetical protein [Paracoccaceae bacterium]